MRLALYWAPEVTDPLHARASAWLGRDAETGAMLSQPDIPGIAEATADPRLYGFHATLKAPLRLSTSYEEARAAGGFLAERTAPFTLPPLVLRDLRGFLAMIESEPCPALAAFADDCVRTLDPHRAPLTPEEIARRRPERLSARQRANLEAWGYHLVFEDFQFHATLTGRLTEDQRAVFEPLAGAFFGDLPAVPRIVRELCLFTQAAPGAPFLIAERLPLRG
ncbi:DUF1045 domain-containing protein [Plastoroseomonas arctica]|uniref:DUF1045 domain-containing protein n=1 Tax=Plastoroseomonas arctica TaxID=1509237 RepID=A0AAF1KJD1_9PROT|nr:DUF1045 domain-containing protein [Plastoroseomonas arctica]MBR0654989.1 DUF1045 domain-containing protein [Plastoroseomonas arctica]